MPLRRTPLIMSTLVPLLAAASLAACGGGGDEALRQLRSAAAGDALPGAHDPCTLLAASEAVPYVGTLATPPYRASDGAPDVHGDQCVYQGTDGREIAVSPTWSGGRMAGSALQGVPNALGKVLARGGATGLDSMAHRVMAQGPAGPWDNATWIPGGALSVFRGDASAQIDVGAASGRESDAVALAKVIVPRFSNPLHYDGAAAVALAPKPHPHPASACDLIPRAAVEAAIGPLSAPPGADAPETSCTYRVATAQGQHEYPVAYVWEGGARNYRRLQNGFAAVGGMLGMPTTSPLDTMHPPPQMQAAIGGLMRMMGSKSGGAATSAAPGAPATVGFRTDTALGVPCDRAMLMHGTQLLGVRRDVFVVMSLQSADYDKAKALLAAICSRL